MLAPTTRVAAAAWDNMLAKIKRANGEMTARAAAVTCVTTVSSWARRASCCCRSSRRARSAGVLCGLGTEPELEGAGADLIVPDFSTYEGLAAYLFDEPVARIELS